MRRNPYTPGSGRTPPFLAGRQRLIDDAGEIFDCICNDIPQRSVMYYGLRGVGKTVLLSAIEEAADLHDIHYTHIEVETSKGFMKKMLASFQKFAREMSVGEKIKSMGSKCMSLISAFSLQYDLAENKVALELSPDTAAQINVLDDDLTEIMTLLGKMAKNLNRGICVFIDEMQYISKEHLRALIVALHRCNQLGLPVVIFGAGLPKALQNLVEAATYAERIFKYEEIGRLPDDEAMKAICFPAEKFDVQFEPDAVSHILRSTQGYPHFIQEFCTAAWAEAPEDSKVITVEIVLKSEKTFLHALDKGFFESRIQRISKSEFGFMFALAAQPSLPCSISDVAKHLGKNVPQISTLRATLINKGMIYSPARGMVDFTVPLFGQYLMRTHHDEL